MSGRREVFRDALEGLVNASAQMRLADFQLPEHANAAGSLYAKACQLLQDMPPDISNVEPPDVGHLGDALPEEDLVPGPVACETCNGSGHIDLPTPLGVDTMVTCTACDGMGCHE